MVSAWPTFSHSTSLSTCQTSCLHWSLGYLNCFSYYALSTILLISIDSLEIVVTLRINGLCYFLSTHLLFSNLLVSLIFASFASTLLSLWTILRKMILHCLLRSWSGPSGSSIGYLQSFRLTRYYSAIYDCVTIYRTVSPPSNALSLLIATKPAEQSVLHAIYYSGRWIRHLSTTDVKRLRMGLIAMYPPWYFLLSSRHFDV